jgi:hypothetical protein
LSDAELLQWLARWGHTNRLELADNGRPLHFHGQVVALTPHLENGDKELSFTHRIALPGGENHLVAAAKFFNHQPPLALVGNTFYLLRNAPPSPVLRYLARQAVRAGPQIEPSPAAAPAQDAVESRRGLGKFVHRAPATPQFVFELLDDTRPPAAAREKPARPECVVLERPGMAAERPEKSRRWTSRKSSTTRASNPRRNGCAGWTGSRRNPACGSAMPMKIF